MDVDGKFCPICLEKDFYNWLEYMPEATKKIRKEDYNNLEPCAYCEQRRIRTYWQ